MYRNKYKCCIYNMMKRLHSPFHPHSHSHLATYCTHQSHKILKTSYTLVSHTTTPATTPHSTPTPPCTKDTYLIHSPSMITNTTNTTMTTIARRVMMTGATAVEAAPAGRSVGPEGAVDKGNRNNIIVRCYHSGDLYGVYMHAMHTIATHKAQG